MEQRRTRVDATSNEWMWVGALVAVYLLTRLSNLDGLPPFIDEAVHVDYARATLRGAFLAGSWDGRWLTIKILSAFVALPIHPLLAARLAAVVAGAGGLVACLLVGRRLFGPTVGLVAGLLYVALPFAVIYDRMALAETFATALAGAVLYFSIAAAESIRRRDVAMLATALVAMFLAKFYTILLVPVPIAAVLLLHPRRTWRSRLLRLMPALVAVAVPLALMVWRGHGIHYVGEQSAAGLPGVDVVVESVADLGRWLWRLLTPPLALALLLAVLASARRREPAGLLLLAMILLAVVPFVLAARVWFPRYLMPMLVPACVLLARHACDLLAAVARRSRVAAGAIAAALLAWPAWLDAVLIVRPEKAWLPGVERAQFFDTWSAGYGVRELAEHLRGRSRAAAGGINVVRLYYWNQANQGLDLYLAPSAALAIHTLVPGEPETTRRLAALVAQRPTFLVLDSPNEAQHLADSGRSIDDYIAGATRVWNYDRRASVLEVWELGK